MQKVFKLNKKDKIEFTKEELKALLDEIYQEGYQEGYWEGKKQDWYWNSPWIGCPVYTTATMTTDQTSGDIHINIPSPASYN